MRRAPSVAGFAALDKDCDIMAVFRRVSRLDGSCEGYVSREVRCS